MHCSSLPSSQLPEITVRAAGSGPTHNPSCTPLHRFLRATRVAFPGTGGSSPDFARSSDVRAAGHPSGEPGAAGRASRPSMPREPLPIRSKQHASHSNRTKQPTTASRQRKTLARRNGLFPFLQLPFELRSEILKLVIRDAGPGDRHRLVCLFLTCRAIYEETASIFYRQVELDTRCCGGSPDLFLVKALTPRLYIRELVLKFYVKDQIGLFPDTYGPILTNMAENGKLHHLTLQLGHEFPWANFWGGSSDSPDLFCDEVPVRIGKQHEKEILAPLFVTREPFQAFLKLLRTAGFPKLSVYLEAADHPQFWCAFHRTHATGECEGTWRGKSRTLKLRWKDMVQSLAGAQPSDPWLRDI